MASSIDVTVYNDSTLMLKVVHLLEGMEKQVPVASKRIYLPAPYAASSKSIQFISQKVNNVLLLLFVCIDSTYTPTDYEIILQGSTEDQNLTLHSVMFHNMVDLMRYMSATAAMGNQQALRVNMTYSGQLNNQSRMSMINQTRMSMCPMSNQMSPMGQLSNQGSLGLMCPIESNGTIGCIVLPQCTNIQMYSATVLITFKNGIEFNKCLNLFSRVLMVSGTPTESPNDYYDKGIGLDVSIMINKNIVKASRYVLGLHSPVFKAMFENDDSRENLIEINDIENDVMLLFVKSLHSVPVQLDNINVAFELYVVANKYNVNDIKQQVQRCIKELICKDTAVNILTLAHNLNIEDIKCDALNFMTSQQYGKIEELQGYNQMSFEIAVLLLNETRNKLR